MTGVQPWARIGGQLDGWEPQATGIPGNVRIIYVPGRVAVEARYLAPGATYNASVFDPLTGATIPIEALHADALGRGLCPLPAGLYHDWVLVLEDE